MPGRRWNRNPIASATPPRPHLPAVILMVLQQFATSRLAAITEA